MVRTQIQLRDEQHRALRKWAGRLGISLSEAVRRCVAERLPQEEKAPTRAGKTPSRAELIRNALSVVGKFRDCEGRSDVARNHDRYLDEAYHS
jgi:hypothetical protein